MSESLNTSKEIIKPEYKKYIPYILGAAALAAVIASYEIGKFNGEKSANEIAEETATTTCVVELTQDCPESCQPISSSTPVKKPSRVIKPEPKKPIQTAPAPKSNQQTSYARPGADIKKDAGTGKKSPVNAINAAETRPPQVNTELAHPLINEKMIADNQIDSSNSTDRTLNIGSIAD